MGGGGHTCLRQWIDVRSTIDRSVCLRRKVIDEEMCALIYLLYERLRGEILKKREQQQRQRGREKDKFKRDQRVCVSYCVGMR